MNKIKIILGINYFYPKSSGGTEQYVLSLAKKLKEKNYHVIILIPSQLEESYEFEGIQVHTFITNFQISKEEEFGIIKPLNILKFSKKIQELNPDIFHLHSSGKWLNTFHLRNAHEQGISTVFTPHLGNNFCIRNSEFMYRGIKECDGKVIVSKCLRCFYQKHQIKSIFNFPFTAFFLATLVKGPLKRWVSYHYFVSYSRYIEIMNLRRYCDTSISIAKWVQDVFDKNQVKNTLIKQAINYNNIVSLNYSTNDKISFLYLGRLSNEKGLFLFLDSIKTIPADDFNKIRITIILIVNIDDRELIETIKNGIDTTIEIKWLFNLNQKEVFEIYKFTDILVVPSIIREAAPLVILEAFLHSIPVIISSSIKSDFVVDGYNGFIFRCNDHLDLYSKIQLFIQKPTLLSDMKKNCKISRNFDDLVSEHQNIYIQLISEKKRKDFATTH